jgi:Tfp pilus assembly pilus retraction ATPase PilT
MVGPSDPLSGHLKDVEKLLVAMHKNRATEMRLLGGARPSFKISEKWHDVGNRPLRDEELRRMLQEVLSTDLTSEELLASYEFPGYGPFLIRVFLSDGHPAMTAFKG